jgi:hypothetical protein
LTIDTQGERPGVNWRRGQPYILRKALSGRNSTEVPPSMRIMTPLAVGVFKLLEDPRMNTLSRVNC